MAHALVFGASGISGWAVVKEALSYPSSTTFARVTGLTNRPLSIEDAQFPQDTRLQLVSGVDLTESVDRVAQILKSQVKQIDTVAYVFFMAYIDPGTSYEDLREVNTRILKTAIQAVLKVTNDLKTVVLQTGAKAYGVEFSKEIQIRAPLQESYPRIPKPQQTNIFYYPQVDTLTSLSINTSWTFTEIRPDVIVGFVPTTNFMSCAQGLALYLSLYREVHGVGAKVTFPGRRAAWTCKHTDVSQDVLARFEIHAALHRSLCGNGRAFNVADGEIVTWEGKWPGICAYFGLEGVGPGPFEPLDGFAKTHAGVWDAVVDREGLKGGRLEKYDWRFLSLAMDAFDFDRQLELSRGRSVGFDETVDTVKGYTIAFDRMRAARVIP